MEKRQRISCIVCPLSCIIEVLSEENELKEITGYSCQRGKIYAEEEVISPKRMLTTTVRVVGGDHPLLPVISKAALPKESMLACAKLLSSMVIAAPIDEGDVVYPNILGLGVDIVASRGIKPAMSL